MSEEIRINVTDLAAYNAGHLHGNWIDATLELDDIQAQASAMLAASPVKDTEEYPKFGDALPAQFNDL
ncbi:antirestriction protein ArdA [Pseudomonas aeruginosa]|nr:antirestriction protein ArdA [Pseudomonas aeruginosa]MDI3611675.1 antirestriction protein ArdA [Pseudomonas aeruginosa]MDI4012094.1 antirestriction protein ArdA [Pseudomonas aeruginosa]MDI4025026.1 antirestriction protein ArdA [Pseudomonas aeruginosa]